MNARLARRFVVRHLTICERPFLDGIRKIPKAPMPDVPKRVAERIAENIKTFQPILADAKARDVNESEVVKIVTDILSGLFGYEKYKEVTSEIPIKDTACDLATKTDDQIQMLIEVKSIGTRLRDPHVRQAVNYARTRPRSIGSC